MNDIFKKRPYFNYTNEFLKDLFIIYLSEMGKSDYDSILLEMKADGYNMDSYTEHCGKRLYYETKKEYKRNVEIVGKYNEFVDYCNNNPFKKMEIQEFKSHNYDFKNNEELLYKTIRTLDHIFNENMNMRTSPISIGYFLNHSTDKTYYEQLRNAVSRIPEKNQNIDVSMFYDELYTKVLYEIGIIQLKDLVNTNVELLALVFSYNYSYLLESISNMDRPLTGYFESQIEKIKSIIVSQYDETRVEIYERRNGIGRESETLVSIGDSFNLTRERIRQIEAKLNDLIIKESSSALFAAHKILESHDIVLNEYVNPEDIEDLNSYYLDYMKVILNLCSDKYKYSYILKVFYLASAEESLSKLTLEKDFYTTSEYESMPSIEKGIIFRDFKLNDVGVYKRKGVNNSDIILSYVDDMFPYGFKISDQGQIQQLSDALNNNGFSYKVDTRIIQAYFGRKDYCTIDRGTFVNRKMVPYLENDLLFDIFLYITNNAPTVRYQSIYEHFSKELNDIGINNYFYLKGVLDYQLPKTIVTTRDYLSINSNDTFKNNLKKYILSIKGVFGLDDISNVFEGTEEYVFESAIRELNCFLTFENKTYINVNQIHVSDEDIDEIKRVIDSQIEFYGATYISANRLYDVMIRTHSELMSRLPLIDSKFKLFSLIQYIFKGQYYFYRPFISINNDKNITRNSIIFDYASKFDRFDINTIANYAKKMKIVVYSFSNFIVDMSEDYVQTNINTMVKKEVLNLSEEDIEKVKTITEYLIDINNGVINTTDNNVVYPSITSKGINGNKYLLVGIIRSYLNDHFIVEQTSSHYNSTDYIIKKRVQMA